MLTAMSSTDPPSRRDRQNPAICGATFGAPVPWMVARRRRTTMPTRLPPSIKPAVAVRRRLPRSRGPDGRTSSGGPTMKSISDHVMLIAAGVTFYALLALVPGLTALVSIYGLFADPVTLDRHMELLEGSDPERRPRHRSRAASPFGGAGADEARADLACRLRHRLVEREFRREVDVRGDECRLRRGGEAELPPIDRRDHGLHAGDVCRDPAPDWADRGPPDRCCSSLDSGPPRNGRHALAG